MSDASAATLATLTQVAHDPEAYVARWKQRTGRKVVGVLPMNFPAEIAHAAGTLPVVIQEDREPDTHGRNLLAEFYCGYTRNLADRAAKGRLQVYDAFLLADHCIQLLETHTVGGTAQPGTPMHFGHLVPFLGADWT